MTRRWAAPFHADRTLHLIGDVHIGDGTSNALSASRKQQVLTDLASPQVPHVQHHLQIGDLTNTALASQDTAGLAFLDDAKGDGDRLLTIGNHDIFGVRSAQDCATAWGMAAKDYTTDLGFAKLIVLGPDWIDTGNLTTLRYDAPTLAWLDTQLTEADGAPCIVAAHSPLYNTVGAGVDPASEFISTTYGFYALTANTPDLDLRAVLGAHDNAIAYLNGHTHSPLTTNQFVCQTTVGARQIAHINASCIAYTKITPARWYDPLCTIYLTVYADKLEVRFRDHAARQWVAGNPDRERCITVPI